ncbi:putative transcription factor bZIP family [Helianthus debilis subsp. tardiflorus]
MKPMDDIWNDIGSLQSTTTNFFPPVQRPQVDATTFLPPPPSTPTMLTLLTPTNSAHEDPNKRPKPNPPPPPATSPPVHSEKFRRLMRNRESAARSRARKQARAYQLEQEVTRLAKENAKLKRLQKEVKKIILLFCPRPILYFSLQFSPSTNIIFFLKCMKRNLKP